MQYRITFETENSQNVSKTPEGQIPNMKSTLLEVKLKHGDLHDTIGQIEFSPDYVDAVVTDSRSRKYKFRANVLWMLLGNGTEWINIKKFALSVS